jgi:hypothetical protein
VRLWELIPRGWWNLEAWGNEIISARRGSMFNCPLGVLASATHAVQDLAETVLTNLWGEAVEANDGDVEPRALPPSHRRWMPWDEWKPFRVDWWYAALPALSRRCSECAADWHRPQEGDRKHTLWDGGLMQGRPWHEFIRTLVQGRSLWDAGLMQDLAAIRQHVAASRPSAAAIAELSQACTLACAEMSAIFVEEHKEYDVRPAVVAWRRVYDAALAAKAPEPLVAAVVLPQGYAPDVAAGFHLSDSTVRLELQDAVARLWQWTQGQLQLKPPAAAAAAEKLDWSHPQNPAQWARVFGVSVNTIKRRFAAGTIRNRKLSTKSYIVAVDDLPANEKGKYRTTPK